MKLGSARGAVLGKNFQSGKNATLRAGAGRYVCSVLQSFIEFSDHDAGGMRSQQISVLLKKGVVLGDRATGSLTYSTC